MIYLDNASTTKPSEAAKEAFLKACEDFGNPSSMHRLGLTAEKTIDGAREQIGHALGVPPKSIYFTSGGTEANNLAILGYCRANCKRCRHIVTTQVEHPSVLAPFEQLKNEGFEVSSIGVDEYGRFKLTELENVLREDTLLVSVMAVNNELGTVMPVSEIKGIMKKKSPKAVLHTDAVQAFGKIPLKPAAWGIDFLSVSAHKIHGIKGTGALYAANERLQPLFFGGGQQRDLRSGTENVTGIAAFGAAVGELAPNPAEMIAFRARMKAALSEQIENIRFNGSDEYQTGAILNVSFSGIKAEILLHMLEAKDIFVSTGSACSTHKPMPSHVLTALGCTPANIGGSVRFSFDKPLKEEEITRVTRETAAAVSEIRKYMR